MKPYLLAWIAFLGVATLEPAAFAQRFNFTYTGDLVTFTVPITGTYRILAFGAQGGNGVPPNGFFSGKGGLGAEIGGDFNLTGGEVLTIAVGGLGLPGSAEFTGGGGGGGSFVVAPPETRRSSLLVAVVAVGPPFPVPVASTAVVVSPVRTVEV